MIQRFKERAWQKATQGIEVGQVWALDYDSRNPFRRERVCTATITAIREGWVQYELTNGHVEEMEGQRFQRIYDRVVEGDNR